MFITVNHLWDQEPVYPGGYLLKHSKENVYSGGYLMKHDYHCGSQVLGPRDYLMNYFEIVIQITPKKVFCCNTKYQILNIPRNF